MSDSIPRLNAALEGRYRIERELGEGGMATVYLANDLKHERKVALKVLKPELAAVVGAERFLAEIKTTANLQHPHILPLYDSGEADSLLFYVMPFVPGESLRERLDREHQLPVDEAVRIAANVAEALDYAHRQAVIHRDIKPANVLLQDGKPVISDFGIALAVGAAGAGRLTETGLSPGTPHYMSPEQATGDRHIGPATDIYALGCVLHEMLVGEAPITGSTPQAILGKIVTGRPSAPSELRESVPAHVDAAVLTALEKIPADRFKTAGAFAHALGDPSFTRRGRVGAPGEGERRGRPHWALFAAGMAAGAAAVLVATSLGSDAPDSSRTEFTVPPPEGVQRYNRCCGPSLALSHDGGLLVFVGYSGGGGRSPLYMRHRGGLEIEEIRGTDDGGIPFFSPDDRWLGFASRSRLWKVALDGSPPVPVTDSLPNPVEAFGADWGEDGMIVFAQSDGLYQIHADGGNPTRVPGTDGVGYTYPWVLPGSRTALVTLADSTRTEPQIVAVDLTNGSAEPLTVGTRAVYASGRMIVSRGDGTLQARTLDVRSLAVGDAVTVVPSVRLGRPDLVGEFAISSYGGLAYHPGVEPFDESLAIVGSGPTVYIGEAGVSAVEEPAFSPDGERIAFRLGTSPDVWIYDRAQGLQQRFTTDGSSGEPVWTRDGRRVTFSSGRDGGPRQLYWQVADQTGPAERLLVTDFATYPGSWLPGDTTLAFSAARESWDIGLVTISQPGPRWIIASEFDEIQPEVSPGGTWLAYASNLSGRFEVYVQAMAGEGGPARVSAGGGSAPRWSADGRTLYYVENQLASALRSDGTLIAVSFATEDGFQVTSRRPVLGGIADLNLSNVNYDVDPEGEGFVVVDPGSESGNTRGSPDIVWIVGWDRGGAE